ncbi:MAG TPA: endonuclease domain-containing protein [Candidatus Eisenbacteria bacterium]|nr:endonuclease domain-containing protein [Candidatus Eisenbacteria bacterium]
MTPPKLTRIARALRKRDTWAEQLLWRWLRGRRFSEYKFRRQHPFGEHVLDFFCIEARLDIELDGGQHGFPESRAQDAERDTELERKGVQVLRFWNSRLRRDKESILAQIWRVLQERAPHPLPDYCRPSMPANTPRSVQEASCTRSKSI